jgi:hypothetical protein
MAALEQESAMPKLNLQEAEGLFEPETTQPLPRVSRLVERRAQARRMEDRRRHDEQPPEDRRVGERRRQKRRRTDAPL